MRWLVGFTLLLAGCATTPPADCPAHTPAPPSPQSRASTSDAAEQAAPRDALERADLGIEVTPVFEPPGLRIRQHVSAKVNSKTWSIRHAGAADLVRLERIDGADRAKLRATPAGGGLSVRLPAQESFDLEYEVRASDFSADATDANAVNPNRLRAGAERLLLLPDEHPDAPLQVSIRIHSSDLGAPQGAASSLGVGELRSLELSSRALRQISLIAGPLGSARFAGPEGQDEIAWVGYTTFDPRLVSAQNAVFRSAVREYFGDLRSTPLTVLLLSDSRPLGNYEVTRRSWSILVHVAAGQPWDGTLSLAVAQAIVREWLGGRLWLGAADDATGQLWFNAGFARYVAREVAFRMGQLEPEEYAAEVEGLTAIVKTSPDRELDNQTLARAAGRGEQGAIALLVARGALWATDLDARLAEPSRGKRGAGPPRLSQILKETYRAAVGDDVTPGQPQSVDDLLRRLEAQLPDARGRFDNWIVKGKPGDLPATALGPCFRQRPRRFPLFALGFALDASRHVSELDPLGPAARAGLKRGDAIQELHYAAGRADLPVRVRFVRGDGAAQKLSYLPQQGSVSGRGWEALKNVPRERCQR
ncbi:MAG: hypothetical protein KC766_34700 [Myxococcales bacterium]|nr:hypothetical protein [Myxococcales bacterium]